MIPDKIGHDKWAAAFNKGDAKAVAAMYTPDAYVLPQGAWEKSGRSWKLLQDIWNTDK